MRIMGKRQLGEMELSEFIVGALIADLAATPLQDIGTPLLNGLVPIFALFALEIIIENSKIDREKMQKNRFTLDELMQELRNQGLSDTTQIEYAVLETNGQLNVILQKSEQPVTPSQLGIPAGSDGYAHIIINEGRILDNNLRMLGRDRSWLDKEIKRQGAASAEDVYLLTLTETGKIFCQRKEQAE